MTHATPRSRFTTIASLSACYLVLLAGLSRAQGPAAATPSPVPEATRYQLYFTRMLHIEQAAAKAAAQTQAQAEELDKAGETKKAAAARALLERIEKGGWWLHAQSAAHLSDQETDTLHRIVDDANQAFTQKAAETSAAMAQARAHRGDAALKAQAKALWDQRQAIITSHIQQLRTELGEDGFGRLDAFVSSTMEGTTTIHVQPAAAAKAQGPGGRS